MTETNESFPAAIAATSNLNALQMDIRRGSETAVSLKDTAVMIFRAAAKKDGVLHGRTAEDICHDLYYAGIDDIGDLIGHFYSTSS